MLTKLWIDDEWKTVDITFQVLTREIWVDFADGEAECEWFTESQKKRAQNYYNKLCAHPPKNAVRIRYIHNYDTVATYEVE